MKKIIFVLMIMLIACPLFAESFMENGTDWTQWDLEMKTAYLAGYSAGAQITIFLFFSKEYVTDRTANEISDIIFPPESTFGWIVDRLDEYYETEDHLYHPIATALYLIFTDHAELKDDLSSEELQQI